MTADMQSAMDRFNRCKSVSDVSMAVLEKDKTIAISSATKHLDRLAELPHLHTLSIGGTFTEKLSLALSKLPSLKNLEIVGCRRFESTIEFRKLELIYFHYCSGFLEFKVIAACRNLRTITVFACTKLKSFEGIERLSHLKEVDITGAPVTCGTVDSLKPLGAISSLTWLSLATRIKDKNIRPIASNRSLEYLWLQNRYPAGDYEYLLGECRKLKRINLHNGKFTLKKGFEPDK